VRRAAIVVTVLAALAAAGCGASAHSPAALREAGLPSTANFRPEVSATARRLDLRRALPLVSGVSAGALGYRIELAPRQDPGLRALTDTDTHVIMLYLAQGDAPHRTAHDLAHELGHAWDAEHMTPATRRAYLARRGVPRATWWPTVAGHTDYEVGAGDFAEVFALCHAASPDFRSRLAPRPADPCAVLPAGAQ
jgi:hypothetical protein